MGSPIGGFYISALNRRQREKFELSKRVQINIDICLEHKGETLISESSTTVVGELLEFSCDSHALKIETQILESGLLHTVCFISNHNSTCKQEFNLSPDEPAYSMVEANEMKVSILAKPYSSN